MPPNRARSTTALSLTAKLLLLVHLDSQATPPARQDRLRSRMLRVMLPLPPPRTLALSSSERSSLTPPHSRPITPRSRSSGVSLPSTMLMALEPPLLCRRPLCPLRPRSSGEPPPSPTRLTRLAPPTPPQPPTPACPWLSPPVLSLPLSPLSLSEQLNHWASEERPGPLR